MASHVEAAIYVPNRYQALAVAEGYTGNPRGSKGKGGAWQAGVRWVSW